MIQQNFARVLSLVPDCLYDSICVYDHQNTQGHEPVPVRVVKKNKERGLTKMVKKIIYQNALFLYINLGSG